MDGAEVFGPLLRLRDGGQEVLNMGSNCRDLDQGRLRCVPAATTLSGAEA